MAGDPAREIGESGGSAGLDPRRAAALLEQLKQAHEELVAAVTAMDEITAEAIPDTTRYPHARWRLSSARRKRRTVAAEIHAAILGAASADEAALIRQLRADDDRRLLDSALHVQKWTSEKIEADWPGYCAAAAPMRAAVREWIATERALLYPLLERYSLAA